MLRKCLVPLLAVLLWCSLPVTPASATFPGQNGRIAFRRFLNTEQTWGAVFAINPDGTGERQVTHPSEGYVDRNPDVSPDGRKIVFEREGPTSDEIYVVNADGSGLTWLSRHSDEIACDDGPTVVCSGSPGWSPDGRRIVFKRALGAVVDDLVETQALFVMDADGSHVRQLTQLKSPHNGEDTDPQWSPDGRRIVFQRWNVRQAQPEGGTALWILDLRSGKERRITPWELRAGDTPDWSPDGKRILFHSNNDGPADESANLYTIRANGTGLKQLTFETGGTVNYLGSSYSPDGRWITVGRRPATGGTAADVYVMRVDGTGIRPVTQTLLYDSYPDWGPAPRKQGHHH